jgi:hypothetical protein
MSNKKPGFSLGAARQGKCEKNPVSELPMHIIIARGG